MADAAPAAATCDCAERLEGLKKSVGHIYQKNGADYHTGEQIISFLNENPGADKWSFRVLEHGYEEMSDEMWAIVELSVELPRRHAPDEPCLPTVVKKQDAGAHQVKRHSQTKLPLSIGDDRKSAITDGLKRCARQLGIGLSLWMKEPQKALPYKRSEAEELERVGNRPTAPQRATGRPEPPAPPEEPERRTFSSGMKRMTAEDRYSDVLAEATEAGFKAEWVSKAPGSLSDQEIVKYGTACKAYLETQRTKTGAAA